MSNFAVFGPYRGVTGYDNVTRNFIRGWWENMHNVRLLEFKEWSNFRAHTEIENILEVYEKNTNQPDFLLNFCLLDQTRIETGIKNSCYTMFEADSICELWARSCEPLDLVIVPTEFNRKSFEASGVPSTKLEVCPVPLNLGKILHKPVVDEVTCGLESLNKYSKRFLNCSEFVGRKNLEGLLRLWTEETKSTDDACLVLKLNSNSGLKLDFLRERVKNYIKTKKCAPIYILTDFLTEDAMNALYHWCTHYITMSYGEGWGMSESICGVLGKTIIAPKHTAFTEYLTDDNAFLINCQSIPAVVDGPVAKYYNGLRWFAPVFFSAKKKLREALNCNDNSRGLALSDKLKQLCDHRKVSQKLVDMVSNHTYKRAKATKPTKSISADGRFNLAMVCKSVGQKCGIADYSNVLYANIAKYPTVVANCLLAGNEAVYYNAFMDKYDINVLHLQLEYQFITPKRLDLLLKYCEDSNVKPLVTLHTVNPRAWDYHEVLVKYKTHILVSSENMRDTLIHACGYSKYPDRVHVVTMGIDKNECITPTSKFAKPTVGFFGFCYFHKGIDRLIRYASLRPEMDFLVYSTKPANDTGYFERCRTLAKQIAPHNVKWIEEYLPENEIVKGLSQTTAIFLPYEEYGGLGVSAAVRTCLKAGTPIMALRNSFFLDAVADEKLLYFVGSDPQRTTEWIQGADEFMAACQDADYNTDFINKRNQFAEKYDWIEVGKMTQNVYKTVVQS